MESCGLASLHSKQRNVALKILLKRLNPDHLAWKQSQSDSSFSTGRLNLESNDLDSLKSLYDQCFGWRSTLANEIGEAADFGEALRVDVTNCRFLMELLSRESEMTALAFLPFSKDAQREISEVLNRANERDIERDWNNREVPSAKPSWCADSRELRFKGIVVRKFVKQAPNCFPILNCFEEDGWPARIDCPLAPSLNVGERRRNAVRALNDGIQGMRFECDGRGEGIIWTHSD